MSIRSILILSVSFLAFFLFPACGEKEASESNMADKPNVAPAPEAIDLAGTTWHLVSMDGVIMPEDLPEPVSLVFEVEGSTTKVSGFSGCNRFFGGYNFGDGQLSFSDLGTSRKACPEPLMDLETEVLAALSKVRDANFEEDQMIFDLGEEGKAVFERQ